MKEKRKTNIILQGNALKKLKELPEKSINMCMTSPPYWALRDYGEGTKTVWHDNICECGHSFEEHYTNDGGQSTYCEGCDCKEFIECEHQWGEKIKSESKGMSVEGLRKWGGGEQETRQFKTNSQFCKKCNAWKGQLGLEPTFDLYIKHLCDIFDEVKRVLRDDGTIWVNLGDTYMGGGTGGQQNREDRCKEVNCSGVKKVMGDIPDKCLTMIPQRFSIEMVNRGWILRNVIIWHKPNCMPSSVKDRFTVDFEYIFFFSKKKKYYFETQYEPHNPKYSYDWNRQNQRKGVNYNLKTKDRKTEGRKRNEFFGKEGRNKRTVWTICPQPFPESHFAVYPEELCETPIKAGCPEFVCKKCGKPREQIIEIKSGKGEGKPYDANRPDGYIMDGRNRKSKHTFKGLTDCRCNAGFTGGVILDPFFGAGTTGLVALKQDKKFIGIELNPDYIEIAKKRLLPYLEQTKLIDL